MKIMFASDVHGSAYYCREMFQAYEKEGAQKLVLLGDLLYHGPRNDLPKEYEPKQVIRLLNEKKEELLCVRGNCEAEVDQMVLEFPIMADYSVLYVDGHTIYATHGHVFNEGNLLPMKPGDILIHGHTHLPVVKQIGDCYLLNPGSVSIPKGGFENSYAIWEDGMFTIRTFSGDVIASMDFPVQ